MRQYILLLHLCLLLFLNVAQGKETVHLATFNIPHFVESKNKGEFIQLVKLITNDLGMDLKISVYPPRRVIKLFQDKKVDGYFPSLDVLNKDLKLIKSKNYYYKKDYFFARKKSVFKDMIGKTLCLTKGYPYVKDITSKYNLKVHFAISDESCLKMLQLKRVDMFLCEALSGLAAMKKTNTFNYPVSKKSVSVQDVYFAFQKDAKGKKLKKHFDKKIDLFYQDGTLKKIFRKAISLAKNKLHINYNPLEK